MAIEKPQAMQRIVRVSEVRKQRLANAAADARRGLIAAEDELAEAQARVDAVETDLSHACQSLSQNPASDQMRIWRDHVSARKIEALCEQADREDARIEAGMRLSQSLRALQRQDLRHDHLAERAKQLKKKLADAKEAHADDDMQGCGQAKPMPLLQQRIR
ncbi:MAG: hypothetical protein ACRCY3_03890 [Sphingorhabdus sp.]